MEKSFINLDNVSLDYFRYVSIKNLKKTILRSAMNLVRGTKSESINIQRALDGVNMRFESGDRIALIGKNGSGKSTLLRILSGIYQPTSGAVETKGNITSLLDINVGLTVDATGYENIILKGILQGKTKRQMKSKFQDIEDFTGLKDYLKLPIRTYSNGMKLRLAFAIATCMESEILIIDEVVGVGDQSFMKKAEKRLKELVHKSEILILTSHSTEILNQFCNKAVVLDSGKCLFYGELQEGIKIYNDLTSSPAKAIQSQ